MGKSLEGWPSEPTKVRPIDWKASQWLLSNTAGVTIRDGHPYSSSQRIYEELDILFTNPSARAGYDTRSVFKQRRNWIYLLLFTGTVYNSFLSFNIAFSFFFFLNYIFFLFLFFFLFLSFHIIFLFFVIWFSF